MGLLTVGLALVLLVGSSNGQQCIQSTIDLVFLIDGSGSICDRDLNVTYDVTGGVITCNHWQLLMTFVHDFVQDLDIGWNGTRVGLVTFSTIAKVEFNLIDLTTKLELLEAIDQLPYSKGRTATSLGINTVITDVFNSIGDRPDVPNVLVLATDGTPTMPLNGAAGAAINAAEAAWEYCKLFTVGITREIDEDLLKAMSSAPRELGVSYFMAPDFYGLEQIRQGITEQVVTETCYTTKAPGSVCNDTFIDIAILVDGSGSICGNCPGCESCSNFELVKDFVIGITRFLKVSSDEARVALVLFSNEATVEFYFNRYHNSEDMEEAIRSIPFLNAATNTQAALRLTRESVFNEANGDRGNRRNVVVMLTDGNPTVQPENTIPEALQLLQEDEPDVFVIGVTNRTNTTLLRQMSSPPQIERQNWFTTPDFEGLQKLILQVAEQACIDILFNGSSTTATPTPTRSTKGKDSTPSTNPSTPIIVTPSSPGPSSSSTSQGPTPSPSSSGPSSSPSSQGPTPSPSSPGPSSSPSSQGPTPSPSSTGPSSSTSSQGPTPSPSSPGPSSSPSSQGPTPTPTQSTFGKDSSSPTTPSTPHIVTPSSPGPTQSPSSPGPSPSSSTSTPSPSPTPSTPASERLCRESSDVVFIVDSSSSIYGADFDLMKNFVADVVNLMAVNEKDSRIGLVQFSTTVLEVFGLATFQTLNTMLPAIRSISWLTGTTNTAEAIEYVSTNMFNGNGGDRAGVRNIAVILTDGGSDDKPATFAAAHASRSNMDILAIGLGDWVDQYELQALASDFHEATLLLVEKYEDLASYVTNFKATLCNDVNECASNPCNAKGQCIDALDMFYCQCNSPYGGALCENECSAAPEVAFLVDSSASIGKQNFQGIVDFTKAVAKQLPLDGGSSVALATFSDSVATYLRIMDPQGVVSVMNALSIPYFVGRSTNTSAALEVLDGSLFQNDREGRPNVAVLITDGYSNDAEATWKAAMAARDKGITLIVVGVGGNARYSELRAIASAPQESNILQISSFSQLMGNVDNVAALLCAGNQCDANPCENEGQCVSFVQGYRCDCTEIYTGPLCERNCMGEIDIIIVLDRSGSIRPERFDAVKSYLVSLLSQFEIDNGKVRVALVAFSNDAQTIFYLDSYTKWQDISEAIMKVGYIGQRTHIASALLLTKMDILQSSRGDRPDVQNFVFLFSDGQANIQEERTIPEAIALRIAGARVVSMSVGTQLAITNLMAIASSPASSNVIVTNSFNTIDDLIGQVVAATCNDKNNCAGDICQNGGTCVDGYNQFICVCPSGRTGEYCDRECSSQLDVGFILDISGSLYNVYALGLEFIRTVIQGLEFRFDRTRAGLILYSDEASVRFYLDTYGDKTDIMEALSLGAVGGRTNTQDALRLANEQIFQANRGDRSEVRNIIILATDGESNIQKAKTLQRAQSLKDQGAEVYVIAIGNRIFMEEVNAIATQSSPSYVYRVYSTDDVESQANALLNVIC